MNEPEWAFSSELPAAGMLYNTAACATREELAKYLRKKYDGDAALTKAWNEAVQQMAVLVGDLKRAVNGDRKTFDVAHARAETARAAADAARAQLDLHRAEHGC